MAWVQVDPGKPHWFRMSMMDDGTVVEAEVKARLADTNDGHEALWWDATSVFAFFKKYGSRGELKNWWRSRHSDIALAMERCGLLMAQHIREPRQKKCTSVKSEELNNEFWSVLHWSTECLIIMLLHIQAHAKVVNERCTARRLGIMLFSRLLGRNADTDPRICHFPMFDASRCKTRAGAGNMCEHLGRICRHFEVEDEHSESQPQIRVWRALVEAEIQQQHCGVAIDWIAAVLSTMADLFSTSATVAYTTDPLKAELAQPSAAASSDDNGKKRKRVDNDYRVAASFSVVRKGQSRSSRIFLRNHGIDPSLAKRWDETNMTKYLSATWECFATAQTISIALDGSRLGQPAEYTEILVACEPHSGQTAWIAPQVITIIIPWLVCVRRA